MPIFSFPKRKKIVIFCKKKHTRNKDGNNILRLRKHYCCSRIVQKLKARTSAEASVPSGHRCQGIVPRRSLSQLPIFSFFAGVKVQVREDRAH